MATPQASSRLELLQARFQQKQLLEKEQKLLQLYDQQQQRAYQVVQRGSAGSNGSGHGSTSSQQTITKTTSTAHTTSNSQGGKVRQMFDERRQTNVKGIDRSYPLEPLENKPRKQVNKSIVQKNGNLTVNRQSVTVKRMTRADVNSNLNGGKPIVSYHEEITQESFGPAGHQELDDNEFGNENHITRYANENQTHIEEVLDEDTIERNRMMAKLHLMDYDETLKHRARNDLESEEFPEDFMVDVPDKLPKQSVKKTLSQAEARLERFKNANAKRSSNVTKKSNTMSKKRPDHVLPEKSTHSKDNSKVGIQEVSERGCQEGGSNIKVVSHKNVTEETSLSSNLEKNMKRKSQNLQSFCKRAEKLITAENDEQLKDWRRGGESAKFFCQKSEKLATTSATCSKTASKLSPELSKDVRRRSEESSTFHLKGSEKSASIYAVDSEKKEKRSSTFSKNTQRESEGPKIFDAKTTGLSDQLTKHSTIRSKFPKFFRKESEKSANSCAVNSRTAANVSPKSSKMFSKLNESSLNPKKPEYSAATVMSDSETAKQLPSIPLSTATRRSESPKYYNEKAEKSSVHCLIDLKSRSSSPNFVLNTKCSSIKIKSKHDGIIPVQSSSSTMDRSVGLDVMDRNGKPRILNKIDKSFSPTSVKNRTTAYKETKAKMSSRSARNDSPVNFERRTRSRKPSGKFVEAHVTTSSKGTRFTSKSPDLVEKIASKRRGSVPIIQPAKSKSPNSLKRSSGKSNTSRQFFPLDFKRSVTVTLMTPETSLRKESQSGKHDYGADTSVTDDIATTGRRTSEEIVDANSKRSIRNSVSLFFLQQCDAASRNLELDEGNNVPSMALGEDQNWSHDSSPLSLKDMRTSSSASPHLSSRQTGEPILITGIANNRNIAPLLCSRSSSSPSPELRGDKFDLKSTKDASIQRAGVHRQIGRENSYAKSTSPDNFASPKDTGNRIERVSPLVLRSTRLIRDTITRQNNKKRAKNLDGNHAEDTMKALESVFSSAGNTDETPTVVDPSESKHRSIPEEKKVETRSEVGQGRCSTPFTPSRMELPAVGTSPTNFGFVEVDTEIQEIVMPDQYIECHRREGSSKLCRETRNCGREEPNAEKFFTYSISKPAKKRRPSLESNVFTLSRKDQRVTSGSDKLVCSKHIIRNATNSPSTTSSSTFRGSNRSKEGSGELNREINAVPVKTREIDLDECRKTETESSWSNSPSPEKKNEKMYRKFDAVAIQMQTGMDFNEREKKEHDNLKCTKRNRSTNPSPTNNLSSCGSTCLEEENRKIDQKINTGYLQSREKVVPDDGREKKRYSLKHTIRDWSNSPSPTNNSTFRSSKYPTEESKNINWKMNTAAVRSQEKIKLNEYKKEEHRSSKRTKRNCLSSSPSPTNNTILRSSKRPKKADEKVNQDIRIKDLRSGQETLNSIRLNTKKKLLDKSDQEEVDDLNDAIRGTSNSPPIGEFTVRSSKRVKSGNIVKKSDKVENLQPREVKTVPNEPRKEDNSKLLQFAIADRSVTANSKRRLIQAIESRRNEATISRKKTPGSIQQRPKKLCPKSPQMSKQIQTLPSLELVRIAVKGQDTKQEAKPGPSHNETTITEITALTKQTEIQKTDSGGVMNIQMSKNYGRTDSVESALKRFDSIGAESVHSMAEKVHTLDESRNESTSVSLKTLDRIDVNHLRSPKNEQRRAPLCGNSIVSQKRDQYNESKTRATQGKREFAKTRNSTEIAWVTMASKSPACKRKLFQHPDFEEKCDIHKSNTKQSLVSMKSPPPDPNIARHESSSETLLEKNKLEKGKIDETSIGASFSAPVKQLRSIEDIRKSMDPNFEREKKEGRSARSAIANSPPKRSNTIQSRRLDLHPVNVDDHVDGSRKRTPLSRRSDNLTAKNDTLGDAECVKYSMRFSRVAKNPSPDSTNGNTRRNASSSSSKVPDTTVTPSSIELKTQEARSTKQTMPMKGTESIGNRKTMTSTSTKKSTDLVDGAILENGMHLRDQTPGTIHVNETITPTMKKDDALVIEFDEQLPKENDTALSRKPLLRKRSTDKQTLPTQSSRPPSSLSSVSGGSTMQGQAPSSKNKTASKAKTSSSGASHKGSTSYKSGLTCTVDNLVPCKTCGRRFAQDRVALHEQICTKTAQKKRKQFDAMMYRVKGTDLEPFVKKGLSKKQPEKFKKCEPKSNWRRKHEDFINAIRSAKQVQAHLAAGGKLSDLPPPPPSDTSDYVQCPHCGRKFNQSAAERHIPKCEHMLHNKPVHSRGPKPKR